MKNKNKWIAALAALSFIFVGNVSAQSVQPSEKDMYLALDTIKLEDVVVSSLKIDKKLAQTPANLSIVNSLDYKRSSSFTTADILSKEPGIAMSSDGMWSKGLNVRGLGEDRMVTLIDGNRVETATDLTASLSMIDVNDIERVEVIKGAQSVLYGSGAMGGIVNVITKDGYFADKAYVHGSLLGGYNTVNNSHSEYLSVMTGAKRWYLKLNASYAQADDVMTPEGLLENSSFKSNNLSAKLGIKPFKNHVFKFQFQRNWSNDVGIPGGAAFAPKATADYKDIGRMLFDASYEIRNITDKFTSLKLSAYSQEIVRNVEMRPNSQTVETMPNGSTKITTPQLVTPNGIHKTKGAQLQGVWDFSDNNTLIAGIDVWRRDVETTRTKYVNVTVLKPNGDTAMVNHVERHETPIPNSSFTSAGVFVQDEMRLLNDKLILNIGGRLDGIIVENEECHDVDYIIQNGNQNNNPAGQRITFEANKTTDITWSANAGAIYEIAKNTDVVLNLARSYRAPSLEERFKYIDLGAYVQLGNQDLKPEDGYFADLGLRYWGDRLQVEGSAFVNRITNMIVDAPGEFIYNTTDGTTDTLPALIASNVSKALLYGFEVDGSWMFARNFFADFSGSYTVGRDTENDTYLPLIPPFSARLGVTYNNPKYGAASLSLLAASKQEKIADGEIPTDGYCRLDFSINSKVFSFGRCGLQLFGGVDNITNTAYVNHLSTNRGDIRFEPGRNFYIRANFTF